MKLTEAINKLKAGIQEGDDDLIEEGFFLLTGERVVFPDEDPSMFAGGQHPHKMTPPGPMTMTDKEPPQVLMAQGQEDWSMNKDKAAPKKRTFVNTFQPENVKVNDEEGAHLLDDNVVPVPRIRAEFKMASVHCQDCNKTIEVNPQFKKEPYHCDLIRLGQTCPNA
tara:strand:- start:9242 stop:9739 length:498 start_codon:yes stop_codon:yes gene_type:complete